MTTRRELLQIFLAGAGGAALLPTPGFAAATPPFLPRTDADWRQRLSPMRYYVLRQEGTERPFTSPLLRETRSGLYACAGCDRDLFDSDAKFDSGSGWPSFRVALPRRTATQVDHAQGVRRTSLHCRGCGGHLGHRQDGATGAPPYFVVNGAALRFRAA